LRRQFDTVDDLIAFLRARKIGEVTLSARVGTTTSPGGEQMSFRGRIVAEAGYGRGSRAEYVEQVMPYIASTRSPDLPAAADHAADLRSAQLALARQLRAYRGEYHAVVDAAKTSLASRLKEAGIAVVESEE
jgi:hypothetical protein